MRHFIAVGLLALGLLLASRVEAAAPSISCSVSPTTITLGQSVEVTITSTRLPAYALMMYGQGFEWTLGPFNTSPAVVTYQPPYVGDWRAHVYTTRNGGGKVAPQMQCAFTVLP